MKIFSKEQIYKGDELTLARQHISSADLMERAGEQIFKWMDTRMQGAQVPIHVFCGIGNNGGDGLVLARQLITAGYHVKTYVVNYSDKRSKDFLINYDRIKNVTKEWPILLEKGDDFPEINEEDIIVDAIFGIGLNRPVMPWVQDLFQHFRASKAYTLSIDIPSGLYLDKVPESDDAVVWASFTLSFASPKLVFFLPETAKFSQQWALLDIGLDTGFLSATKVTDNLFVKYDALKLYQPRDRFAHKGNFGHVLIIGGSHGKIGAVTLASKSALSVGSGLVTAYVPKCGYIPLQAAFPEAMVMTDGNETLISDIKFQLSPTAIAVGVGLGTAIETVKAFETFLQANKTKLVIDADGINILSKNKTFLKWLPSQTILTPHPKELERLIGKWEDDFDKLEKVRAFSKTHDSIVVIKGAYTITVYGDMLYVNSTGNPGLATAGSGDVLTGIITGLLAQGYEALSAAIFGVYLHGKSADIAIEDVGYQSLIASHIIEYLGPAYVDLFKAPEPTDDTQAKDNP